VVLLKPPPTPTTCEDGASGSPPPVTLLLEALPIWKRIHAAVEAELQGMNADPFRTALLTVS
jgi:hypothetical protein